MTYELKDAGTDSKNRKIFVLTKSGRSLLTLRSTDADATEWMDKIVQHIRYARNRKLVKDSGPTPKHGVTSDNDNE